MIYCECVIIMIYSFIYIYLSVRRGGDEAFAGCSQNDGSARGRSTGVRPHRSTNSMREMIAGAAMLYWRARALGVRGGVALLRKKKDDDADCVCVCV